MSGEALGWHGAGLHLLRRINRLDDPTGDNVATLRLAASELFDVAMRIHVAS